MKGFFFFILLVNLFPLFTAFRLMASLSLSSSTPVPSFNLVNNLKWRQALKTFKPLPPGYQVDISPILESIQLAPSSLGIQPYNVHIVTNPTLKEKLRQVSYDQAQVTDCSHLLVFCARNDAHNSIERMISSNNLDEVAKGYGNAMRSVNTMTPDEFLKFSSSQAFVGLGIGVSAAAASKIGHCPMGGFEPEEVKKLLKLPENQFPVAYLAIGSALDDGTDVTKRTKFRLPLEELFTRHD